MSNKKDKTLPKATIFRRTERESPENHTAERLARKPSRQRIKATFYLYPEDVLAIDSIQSEEFRKSGKKPERSEVVSRAIQLFKQQTA